MFGNIFKINFRNHNLLLNRRFCTPVTEKWDLFSAVCIERNPVITPLLNDLEQRYQNLVTELEFEQSLKSDYEVRHEKDVKQQQSFKKGDDVDVVVKETAQDFVDAATEELSHFKFGSRITEDEKNTNLKSLNRKLDKHLILLIKQKLGTDSHFLLPQGHRQDGETLRQAAERVMNELCGGEIKAQFYGNAPAGFYKYKYPKSLRDENKVVGAKVFIYVAKHKSGTPSEGIDFKWLDRVELSKELKPNYYNSVSQFLFDER